VRYDSTRDTGDVAAEEGDSGLLQAVVRGLWLAKGFVDLIDSCFEGGEFAHGVGDLTAPEGVETFVESVCPFISTFSPRTGKLGGLTQQLLPP